jgi:hypothetical protein
VVHSLPDRTGIQNNITWRSTAGDGGAVVTGIGWGSRATLLGGLLPRTVVQSLPDRMGIQSNWRSTAGDGGVTGSDRAPDTDRAGHRRPTRYGAGTWLAATRAAVGSPQGTLNRPVPPRERDRARERIDLRRHELAVVDVLAVAPPVAEDIRDRVARIALGLDQRRVEPKPHLAGRPDRRVDRPSGVDREAPHAAH